MIASILWDVDPVWFKVGSWEVRWYGLMWGLGFILAYEMVGRLFKKEKYPEALFSEPAEISGKGTDTIQLYIQRMGRCTGRRHLLVRAKERIQEHLLECSRFSPRAETLQSHKGQHLFRKRSAPL